VEDRRVEARLVDARFVEARLVEARLPAAPLVDARRPEAGLEDPRRAEALRVVARPPPVDAFLEEDLFDAMESPFRTT
jgi:hypothetical protein